MNDFTASNGMKIILTNAGQTSYVAHTLPEDDATGYLGFAEFAAYKEFFRAEEDERLGRWRWPENPDYVIYPEQDGVHYTLNVCTGVSYMTTRNGVAGLMDEHAEASRAYFDAHPEPKPWHDASEGEVWIITLRGGDIYPAIFQVGRFRDHGGSWDAGDITDARRIWPEVTK